MRASKQTVGSRLNAAELKFITSERGELKLPTYRTHMSKTYDYYRLWNLIRTFPRKIAG